MKLEHNIPSSSEAGDLNTNAGAESSGIGERIRMKLGTSLLGLSLLGGSLGLTACDNSAALAEKGEQVAPMNLQKIELIQSALSEVEKNIDSANTGDLRISLAMAHLATGASIADVKLTFDRIFDETPLDKEGAAALTEITLTPPARDLDAVIASYEAHYDLFSVSKIAALTLTEAELSFGVSGEEVRDVYKYWYTEHSSEQAANLTYDTLRAAFNSKQENR